jgi:predicted Zn-dependent protease
MLVLLAAGCAVPHRRGAAGFGPAVPLPEDAAALGHFFRGEMALAQNDGETAMEAFEAAIAADPATPFLRLRLASLYVRSGQLPRALEQVNAVVAAEPDNVDALGLQAGVLSSLGRDEEAAAAYERILARSRQPGRLPLPRGALQQARRHRPRGRDPQKLTAKNPGSILGYYYLGRVMRPDASSTRRSTTISSVS